MTRFGALERFEILGAVLGGLWCGALYLPWFGIGGADGGDVTGAGLIDSAWLPLVIVAVASALLLLDAANLFCPTNKKSRRGQKLLGRIYSSSLHNK